jgi:hypothetical protein
MRTDSDSVRYIVYPICNTFVLALELKDGAARLLGNPRISVSDGLGNFHALK